MKARVKQIEIPEGKRIVCISDIHGEFDLLIKLFKKVNYNENDVLCILGDFFTKGSQNKESFEYIKGIADRPDVHILRGNCDWDHEPFLAKEDKEWLDNLPHIIESRDYIFVHDGIKTENLADEEVWACKNDAFMEMGLKFSKWVMIGHLPVDNYCHEVGCSNPIVNEELRIIAIDGGNVVRIKGQLNAFIIESGVFRYEAVDKLPIHIVEKAQEARGGLHITWFDRFIEPVGDEDANGFREYRHIKTGKTLRMPKRNEWVDNEGRICAGSYGTDYYLPVKPGDAVSVVGRFGNLMFAKKDGISGWIEL